METANEVIAAPAAAATRRAIRRGHLGYVDGARGIAAVYVALHHGWLIVTTSTPIRGPVLWWLYSWLSYGHYAVSAFIAISGFSLMLPVVRGNGHLPGGAWTFFKRRARRILPPYYFAIGFSLIMIWLWIGHPSGTSWDSSLPVGKSTILVHLLLLNDFWPSGYYLINGVFWSIPLEWHIYFLFPVLLLLARRFGTAATCLATAVAGVALYEILGNVPARDLLLPPYLPPQLMQFVDYVGLFALGMLGAMIAFSPRPRWCVLRERLPWGPIAAAAFVGVCFVLIGPFQGGFESALEADVLTALTTLALFIAASRTERGIVRAVLGARPIAFTGTFAYSIYLVHAPIIAAVFLCIVRPHISDPLRLPFPVTVTILLAIAIPIALIAAYLFFLVCERPFLNPPQRERKAALSGGSALATAGVAGSE